MDFLTGRQELDRTRFSISSEGTVPREAIVQSALFSSSTRSGTAGRSSAHRVLEITTLERSIYH
jgi:hypothetical protein